MALVASQIKLRAGDQALDFNLQGTDGQMYSLTDFSGKEGLLLIFMCNHCPYVKTKIAAMKKLYDEFKDQIAFVGINSNDPEYMGEGMANMKIFAQEQKIEFPYLIDDTQEVARAYGATCTPDPFLFDKASQLVFHGRINNALGLEDISTEDTLRERIIQVLRGEKTEKWFEPSQGCSIKWKQEPK